MITLARAPELSVPESRAGFSTLEAIVAIGILGLCILPLMDFQMTIAEGASRLSGRNTAIELEMRAQAYLRALPPAGIESGAARLGAYDLVWAEEGGSMTKPAVSEDGAPGRFSLRLVALTYQVRQGQDIVAEGQMERLIWRPTAPFLQEGEI